MGLRHKIEVEWNEGASIELSNAPDGIRLGGTMVTDADMAMDTIVGLIVMSSIAKWPVDIREIENRLNEMGGQ